MSLQLASYPGLTLHRVLVIEDPFYFLHMLTLMFQITELFSA